MLNWWRQRKMRWAVREVNRRTIRSSEIGTQVVLTRLTSLVSRAQAFGGGVEAESVPRNGAARP